MKQSRNKKSSTKEPSANIRRWRPLLPAAGCGVCLIALCVFLLKGDSIVFLTWWLLALLLGILFLPVTGQLFSRFQDKGWVFSKVLAVAVCGFAEWFLVNLHVLKFTTGSCIGVVLVFAVLCFWIFVRESKKEISCFPVDHWKLILLEECIFFAIFLMWTYVAGFKPEAYGTEKFMDYGFMEAMMRSTKLPATDLWYSEGTINYYYGGQYFAVFLTKLTGARVEVTYNLMRTYVAAFAYVLPFSLVYQMMTDLLSRRNSSGKTLIAAGISGLTAGTAVSITGNMHYVIYGCILPFLQKMQGKEVSGYWFPDATRYIGFHPDVPDKTIHEFPCYSFVLGDLHAHVVNIMFVLLLVGILYAWMLNQRSVAKPDPHGRTFWLKEALHPHLLLACWLLGVYQLNNYWDFVIYFVVTGGVVLFTNLVRFEGKARYVLGVTLIHAVEMVLISMLVILPFTLQFETMVQGVRLAQYHSLPHQLLVLWGLPVFLTICLFLSLMMERLRNKEIHGISGWMDSVAVPDLFAVITGLCAMGLVLIPELVYVRDIYENGNARANTMFKLTYQAYILFGITIGYAIYRVIFVSREKILKGIVWVLLFFWIWTAGYFGKSVESWFGHVTDPSGYRGLDALQFLETDFSQDAAAIRWLKENISDAPVVLEANGDSYTGFERVSATTGLPTVLGWYVHEWLWRNDVADLNEKSADIETIYTVPEDSLVKSLIEEYNISYIFVGSKEREKYGENLQEEFLKTLGEVVFEDPVSGTFILSVES